MHQARKLNQGASIVRKIGQNKDFGIREEIDKKKITKSSF